MMGLPSHELCALLLICVLPLMRVEYFSEKHLSRLEIRCFELRHSPLGGRLPIHFFFCVDVAAILKKAAAF